LIPDATDIESRELLRNLSKAFKNVTRNGDISLHETEAIDRYEDEKGRANARARDLDTRWEDVPRATIDGVWGVGGLGFLGTISFRYYTPAYLKHWTLSLLEKREYSDAISYFARQLMSDKPPLEELFTKEQLTVIAHILYFLALTLKDPFAIEPLARRFHIYLPSKLKTKRWHEIRKKTFKIFK